MQPPRQIYASASTRRDRRWRRSRRTALPWLGASALTALATAVVVGAELLQRV